MVCQSVVHATKHKVSWFYTFYKKLLFPLFFSFMTTRRMLYYLLCLFIHLWLFCATLLMDVVILVTTIHILQQRVNYLRKIEKIKIGFVEHKKFNNKRTKFQWSKFPKQYNKNTHIFKSLVSLGFLVYMELFWSLSFNGFAVLLNYIIYFVAKMKLCFYSKSLNKHGHYL